MSFLRTFSDFRLALGVLGDTLFRCFLKSFSFSLKLETSDFERQYHVFGVFSGFREERQTNEKNAVWIFLFFSVWKGTLLNRFCFILVWFLVSFFTPGTDQKQRNNVHFINFILRSRDRPGFRFGVILDGLFVLFMCLSSHSQAKRVFLKNTLVKQMKDDKKRNHEFRIALSRNQPSWCVILWFL